MWKITNKCLVDPIKRNNLKIKPMFHLAIHYGSSVVSSVVRWMCLINLNHHSNRKYKVFITAALFFHRRVKNCFLMNLYVINLETLIVSLYLANPGKLITFHECWANDKNIHVHSKLTDTHTVNIINRVFHFI